MKQPLIPLLLALAGALSAAQEAATTFFLDASRLETTPGIILVSPGYTTLLELPGAPDEQFGGNANLIDLRTSGNLVALFPKTKAGETDLILRVEGKTLLFRVRITEQGTPRRYVIRPSPTGTLAPGTAAFSPGASYLLRSGVAVTAQARRTERGQTEVLVEIRSARTTPLAIAQNRIEASSGQKPVSFTVIRQGANLLGPLQATVLRILVNEPAAKISIPLEGSPPATVVLNAAPKRGTEWQGVEIALQE